MKLANRLMSSTQTTANGDANWDNVALCLIPTNAVGQSSIWSTSPLSCLATVGGSLPITEVSGEKCLTFNGLATNHVLVRDNFAWMNDGVTPWTFDFVIYETTSAAYEVIFINTTNDSAGVYAYVIIQLVSGKLSATVSGGNAAYGTNYFSAAAGSTIPLNQFCKVRITFDGTYLSIYTNTQLIKQGIKINFSGTGIPNVAYSYIGRYATTSYPLSASIKALRITKGIACPGTEDFDIVSEAKKDPNRQYLDMCVVPFGNDGLTYFTDISALSAKTAVAGAGVVTATVDGTKCISFPGLQGITVSSTYTYIHDGVTPWTMDCVVRIASNPAVVGHIIGNFTNNTINNVWGYFHFYINTEGKVVFSYAGTAGSQFLVSPSIPLNTFTKIRVTYDGSVLTMFIAGVQVGSVTLSGFTASVYQVLNARIGRYPNTSTYGLTGHIAGIRIYKNIVLPGTEDYTVPFEIA